MQMDNLNGNTDEFIDLTPETDPSPHGLASVTLYNEQFSETLHRIQSLPSFPVYESEANAVIEQIAEKNHVAQAYNPPLSIQRERKRSFGIGWFLRRLVALLLISATLGWLCIAMVFPITSYAVVNARIVQVRAPIDGITNKVWSNLGDEVTPLQPLFQLNNAQIDSSHLGMLTTKQAELNARNQRLTTELHEVVQARAVCQENAEQYKQGRLQLLKAVAQEGNASFSIAKYQLDSSQKQLQRLQRLAKRDAATTVEMEIGQENESVAKKRLEKEQASLVKTDTEMKAIDQGIFLQAEIPYFVQRGDELKTKIAQVRANLKETQLLLDANAREIDREQERVQLLSTTTAGSPVSGIVWTRPSNAGQLVKQNELMYEIADTSTIFVEAYIHQRHLSSVAVGSRATIILTGGKSVEGRVRAIRTPGLADSESSTALKLPNNDLKQVRIIVGFDSTPNDAHLIGRHARVLLQDENPSRVQKNMSWLFRLIGS